MKTHAPLVPCGLSPTLPASPPATRPVLGADRQIEMQSGAQALVSWVTPGHGNQPLQSATFEILLLYSPGPSRIFGIGGRLKVPSPAPANPRGASLTLSCPGLAPTPDREALEAQDAQLGACPGGIWWGGRGVRWCLLSEKMNKPAQSWRISQEQELPQALSVPGSFCGLFLVPESVQVPGAATSCAGLRLPLTSEQHLRTL